MVSSDSDSNQDTPDQQQNDDSTADTDGASGQASNQTVQSDTSGETTTSDEGSATPDGEGATPGEEGSSTDDGTTTSDGGTTSSDDGTDVVASNDQTDTATTGDQTDAADGGTDGSGGSSTSTPSISPFAGPSSLTFTSNAKLQAALSQAIASLETRLSLKTASCPVPFSITEITDPSNPFPYAGYRDGETDYIASEAKVAVLYAAYALRDMVRRFAAAGTYATAASLFSALTSQMTAPIRSGSPRVKAATNISDVHRFPKYSQVVTATPNASGSLDIAFTTTYDSALENMIVPSSNADAGTCIHGLGYSYLDGALTAAGFFDDSSGQGLWVGGDFSSGAGWPYVRIPAVNDVDTAQGGNTCQMAKLVSLIMTNGVLSSSDCGEMATRLAHAATGPDTPWTARTNVLKTGCITQNKLGLGPLKNGKSVRSEVSVLDSPVAAGRKYVVAWQNLIDLAPIGLTDIATVIQDTITTFES